MLWLVGAYWVAVLLVMLAGLPLVAVRAHCYAVDVREGSEDMGRGRRSRRHPRNYELNPCRATKCSTLVQPYQLFCEQHWHTTPMKLKLDVLEAMKPYDETSMRCAVKAVIRWCEQEDGIRGMSDWEPVGDDAPWSPEKDANDASEEQLS